MTTEQFCRLALSFPETEEKAHMGHPDFRVAGRIFATVCYPQEGWGMVRLTPEQQQEFVHDSPQVFMPVKGGWGSKDAQMCFSGRRRGRQCVRHCSQPGVIVRRNRWPGNSPASDCDSALAQLPDRFSCIAQAVPCRN